MPDKGLLEAASADLFRLCTVGDRSVGAEGNGVATAYFADTAESVGWAVASEVLDCLDWRYTEATLDVGGRGFSVASSPYALGCDCCGPLCVVSSVEQLRTSSLQGSVVLLRGEIAREPLMPKGFPFYNPDTHKEIVHLLETKGIQALVTAPTPCADLAGGLYPYSMIEDGDFEVPAVFMSAEEGKALASLAGENVRVVSDAERIPTTCMSVTARRGPGTGGRVVVFAHIDAKKGTPGAVDNAAGVVVLLLLARILDTYTGPLAVELFPANGEDYYAAPGQIRWVERNRDCMSDIVLGINVDDAGYAGARTAYSLYECTQEIARGVRSVAGDSEEMIEGPPWYQSDHSIFVQNGVQAMAVTSEAFEEVCASIAHTSADTPEIVDCDKLVETAQFLAQVIRGLGGSGR